MSSGLGRFALLLGICAIFGGKLFAQGGTDKLDQIATQQAALKRQLDAGELALTPRQANVLRASQAEIFELTRGAASLADLDMNRRVRLENALERINALVVGTRAASSTQQVCKRVPVTGSTVKTTRCATQAEWDEVRETSRNSLEKQRICTPPGCGT